MDRLKARKIDHKFYLKTLGKSYLDGILSKPERLKLLIV